MARYCIETYGCQMNVADSELLSGILEARGWEPARGVEGADLVIFNTCSVRERAAQRVIGRVQSVAARKRRNPGLRLVVAGCLPQHLGEDLAARLPEVDLFIGPDAYRTLPDLLEPQMGEARLALERDRTETYEGIEPIRQEGIHAWISIMRGCDRFCTYCAVPFGRGRERSVPADRVLETATRAAAEGYVVVTLLGQAVTAYQDETCDFACLLGRLASTPGLRQIRFLAPHPGDFSPRLLEVMAAHPIVSRHLHLPVQSGSNRILEVMRRGYTREAYLELIREARHRLPGVGITTDILVGFPGETEAEYQETVDLMEQVRFDSAFLFAYSPRARTYAARFLADDVPDEEKKRRLAAVIELQEAHSRERFGRIVGEVRRVLVEGPAKESPRLGFGRCEDFKPVVIDPGEGGEALRPGSEVKVRIMSATSHTLRGRRQP